jgi:hypothetical protein
MIRFLVCDEKLCRVKPGLVHASHPVVRYVKPGQVVHAAERTLWYVKPGLAVHAAVPGVVKSGLVVHAADPVVCEARASSTCCRPCGT